MKKAISVVLTLMMALALVACGGGGGATSTPPADGAASTAASTPAAAPASTPAQGEGPVAEEVKGVTIPEFSVNVNGVELTQVEMAEYPIYSVMATSTNSAGTVSTTTYVGFKITDLLAAAGLSEKYVWLQATADDGYAVTFSGDVVMEDTTLLAMTKDGSAFDAAPWFAPCTDEVTGNYLKGTVAILVNTSEGAPDISLPDATGGGDASGDAPQVSGELPEILDRTDKVEFEPFSFKVNGEDVSNDTLAGLSIYKISVTTENSNGEAVESDYTGYQLADVLEACGVSSPASVTVVANDGYESELTTELIASEYTLVAIEKDKALGEDGTVWLAPCSETSSKSFMKLVVEIKAA